MLTTKPCAPTDPSKKPHYPWRSIRSLRELTVETILLMAGSRADGKGSRGDGLGGTDWILVIAIKREQRLLLHSDLQRPHF